MKYYANKIKHQFKSNDKNDIFNTNPMFDCSSVYVYERLSINNYQKD